MRYAVLAALCAAAMISYISRNALSVAEDRVREELELSLLEMGWVMSAFFITYALFQIPGGWLARVWGSRRALAVFACVWSVSTALMGVAAGFWSLFLTRLVMGMAQAGLFPGSAISIRQTDRHEPSERLY